MWNGPMVTGSLMAVIDERLHAALAGAVRIGVEEPLLIEQPADAHDEVLARLARRAHERRLAVAVEHARLDTGGRQLEVDATRRLERRVRRQVRGPHRRRRRA